MPPSDSSDSATPQPPRKNPPRRDPRLDAKGPAASSRSDDSGRTRDVAKTPSPSSTSQPAVPVSRSARQRNEEQTKTPPREQPREQLGEKTRSGEPFQQDALEFSSTSKKRNSNRSRLWIGLGVSGALLVAIFVAFGTNLLGPQTARNQKAADADQGAVSASRDEGPLSELRPPKKPVTFRILTPEEGFVAFVDGHPVRTASGELVLTPCEVELERGEHVVRVEKQGWNDNPRTVQITEPMSLEQQPVDEPFSYQRTTFKAPFLNAKVGEPILLQTLQLTGRCQDPFVSHDGCEIWYAGNGPGGVGVYYSSRPSAYEEWDTPAILILSKGTDLPASPSATENGLTVAYTYPGMPGTVWSLSRKNHEASFDEKKDLFYAERGEPNWPSAQLAADGKHLYWHEIRDGKASSWMTGRFDLDLPFGKGRKIKLPGGHPNLSVDELRQYVFDGKKLQRARRPDVDSEFAEPRVIAELNLPDYVPHPERRQFWVTDDEQWLYYSPNPESSDSLYAVRLHAGPARGPLVTAKSIPSVKPTAIAKSDPPEMKEIEGKLTGDEEPAKAVVDPKSLPTPYADFQQKLSDLLSKRDVKGAAELIQSRGNSAELQNSKELVAWDKAEVNAIQQVWSAIETAVQALKPEDPLRLGGNKYTFDSYSDGVLHLTSTSKKVERKLSELTPGDLLVLAEKVLDKAKPETQYATGVFLHFEGKAQASASKIRLDKAGPTGDEFRERLAVRRLRVIEQELARQNLSVALKLIDEMVAGFPKSPSTAAAEKHREQIYSFVKWNQVGGRNWQRAEDSSYIATAEKKPGALLMSEQEYTNFDLSLEWKTTSRTGQGGIYFRYNGNGKPSEAAFKIHLANDAGVKPDKFCTGSIFNYNPPLENVAKPSGQWNTLSMQVRGDRVLVLINGKKVQESLATDAAVPPQGFVALDGEFGGIDYRKILLVEAVAPAKK